MSTDIPNIRYIATVYYAYWKNTSKQKFAACGCTRYGGHCTQALQRGEKLVRVIYWVNRGKKWRRAEHWRLDCYLTWWPQHLAEYARREATELTGRAEEWFSKNQFEDKRGRHTEPRTGRPRVTDKLGLTEQQAEQRLKLLKLYGAYMQRLRELQARSLVGLTSKQVARYARSLRATTDKLAQLFQGIMPLGGPPKTWVEHIVAATPSTATVPA